MAADSSSDGNVKRVVPFLRVSDMQRSLPFYTDGLGFSIKNKWVVEEKTRWCSLELGNASLMLQEFPRAGARLVGT
jgi:catechol 2,3-dioxygenase-like lactoylglutathione lyase family enzyme